MNEIVDVRLRCHGCAAVVDPLDPGGPAPYRCPNADLAPDVDHVLVWDPAAAGMDDAIGGVWPTDQDPNPFIRYRTLSHGYWTARARGWSDTAYTDLVTRLDKAVAAVEDRTYAFATTPMFPLDHVSAEFGIDLWAKQDASGPAGSHKARHLFGLLIHLDVAKISTRTPLAIASCGNAALAAATLARAVRRPIEVFVPVDANPHVLDRLRQLGAQVTTCARRPDDPPGDPCIHRFREAVRHRGALPFCVQGPENGLTLDGGATMGHELADQLSLLGGADRLVMQVGGGALGTSTWRGLSDAVRLGALDRLPTPHFVQTQAAAPLHRAWRIVAERARDSLAPPRPTSDATPPDPFDLLAPKRPDPTSILDDDEPADVAVVSACDMTDADLAASLVAGEQLAGELAAASRDAIGAALRIAVTNRHRHMWPWESGPAGPTSLAYGIVDDETYDWWELVGALLRGGGTPLVVGEDDLAQALADSHAAELPLRACATGAAGLGGVRSLARSGALVADERVVVLLTGRER